MNVSASRRAPVAPKFAPGDVVAARFSPHGDAERVTITRVFASRNHYGEANISYGVALARSGCGARVPERHIIGKA